MTGKNVHHPRPPIEMGLGAVCAQTLNGTSAENGEALTLALDACVLAENEGMDSAWFSEHHFAADGYLPSPLTMLAALSQRTERIRLATNIMIGPLYNPIRLAEDAAVLDHLSNGRLMLGLGLGYRESEYAGLGRNRRERGRRLDELLTVLRQAWSGKPVEFHGLSDYSTPPVTPSPRQEGGPALLVGAFADVGIRRAAELGNGWIAPELSHPKALSKRLAVLELQTRTEPFHVALTINAFVAAQDAWATVRPGVEHVGRQYRSWLNESGDLPSLKGKQFGSDGDAGGKPPQFVAGTPRQCIDQLLPWWQILADLPANVTGHITIRTIYPGVPRQATLESVRLLAREVLPALRASTPPSH
ncbi:LLM class flavin-dependent oxidoreductase [Mycolicibacterium vinylchloridicum]|uniref:LLM class flavin-dependent oxidoreductase n=1 Tax=Mycolicibacterium vinylchloridicum TaxID=2736928 RepID=UPI001F1BC1E0|nr:LLM class flavin-dependent oxidoreductase [Mycolicibacterium vinylchloridicum]